MYLSEKLQPIDFYKEQGSQDMMIEVVSNGELPPPPLPSLQQTPQHQMILGESSGEDHEVEIKAPKKRAETWAQDETRHLISLRRAMDVLFNSSKFNKHLWEQISAKMRDKGFDRSPTMCTDKWRNLLKELKKSKHQDRGTGSTKMSYPKEIEEILKERSKGVCYKSPTPPKVDSYTQFIDEGGKGRSCCGRVISVKWGDYTRRIGIDGTSEAIKESIRVAFRLRTKCLFWLEDEDQIIRSLDCDMPLGNYTLHLDGGMAIKVCLYDESDHIPVHTEEKIFYTEDYHRDFLTRRGWTCLREFDGYRNIDNMDDLQPGAIYRGVN